jgi:hypothetical protein
MIKDIYCRANSLEEWDLLVSVFNVGVSGSYLMTHYIDEDIVFSDFGPIRFEFVFEGMREVSVGCFLDIYYDKISSLSISELSVDELDDYYVIDGLLPIYVSKVDMRVSLMLYNDDTGNYEVKYLNNIKLFSELLTFKHLYADVEYMNNF